MNMSVQPAHGNVLGAVVIVIGAAATLWTILAAIYWTVRPGETNADHPKYLIFKDGR